MHYYYWNGEPWNGFDVFFSLLMSVLWILLIVWLVRTVVQSRHWKHHHETGSPLEIAKGRYAKGELTEAEYDALKKKLEE